MSRTAKKSHCSVLQRTGHLPDHRWLLSSKGRKLAIPYERRSAAICFIVSFRKSSSVPVNFLMPIVDRFGWLGIGFANEAKPFPLTTWISQTSQPYLSSSFPILVHVQKFPSQIPRSELELLVDKVRNFMPLSKRFEVCLQFFASFFV